MNDLGYVSYRNRHFALDLLGFPSPEALKARQRGNDPMWMDHLAKAKDVRIAMIYSHWFKRFLPPNWVPVAELKLTVPQGTVGGKDVTFYAIDPDVEAELVTKLQAFALELPASAELKILNSGQ